MIHDFCLQFSKKVAYSELTERILLFSKQWFVGRKVFSDEQKKNHEQNKTTKQNLILDLLMVLDKTQTLKVLLLHLSKMIDVK